MTASSKESESSGCRNNVSSFNFAQTLEGCALCTLCIYSISWETSSSAFPAWRAFKDFQSIYGYGCLHCRRGARGKADLETVRIFKSWFQMLRSSLRWMLSLNPTNVNQCNSQSLLEPLPPNFHYLLLFQPRFYPPFTAVHFGRPLSFKSTFSHTPSEGENTSNSNSFCSGQTTNKHWTCSLPPTRTESSKGSRWNVPAERMWRMIMKTKRILRSLGWN